MINCLAMMLEQGGTVELLLIGGQCDVREANGVWPVRDGAAENGVVRAHE